MMAKNFVKARILLRQNLIILFAVGAWFGVNFIILLFENSFAFKSIEYLLFIEIGTSAYDQFYSRWGDYVMFTFVLGVLNLEAFRNYHPRKTCEILASKMEDHAILFGYTQLGARMKTFLEKNGIPCIVVSRNEDEVTHLVEREDPVVIYEGDDENLIKQTNLKKARYLFLCENNNFQNLKILIEARKYNPSCTIVAHVMDDHLIPIYESYHCFPIATSTIQAQNLINDYVDTGIDELYFIGFNNFTKKAIEVAIERSIKCTCIEKDAGDLKDFKDFFHSKGKDKQNLLMLIEGNYTDKEVLQGSGIFHASVVIITEDIEDDLIHVVKVLKDVNPAAKIIVRCFNDEIAKIFECFGCSTISTSRYELEDEIKPFLHMK